MIEEKKNVRADKRWAWRITYEDMDFGTDNNFGEALWAVFTHLHSAYLARCFEGSRSTFNSYEKHIRKCVSPPWLMPFLWQKSQVPHQALFEPTGCIWHQSAHTWDCSFSLWSFLSASVPENRATSSPVHLPQCCCIGGQDGGDVLTYLLLRTHQKHGGLRCYWICCLICYVFIYIEFLLCMFSPTLHPCRRKSSSKTFSDLHQSDWGDSQIFKH